MENKTKNLLEGLLFFFLSFFLFAYLSIKSYASTAFPFDVVSITSNNLSVRLPNSSKGIARWKAGLATF